MNTMSQFAWQLGAHDRVTLAHSLVWHKAYLKATPETRAAWREDWVANFVAGNLQVPLTKAQAICAKTRSERTADQEKAVNTAGKKFAYHISRTDAKSSRTEPAKPTKVRVSAAERAAWDKFVRACGSAERAAAVAAVLAK
jgi:hypothetical protein